MSEITYRTAVYYETISRGCCRGCVDYGTAQAAMAKYHDTGNWVKPFIHCAVCEVIVVDGQALPPTHYKFYKTTPC
jgi:hypothetical protein